MIYYDKATSPSFELNKTYCERIEEVAAQRGAFCMGSCSDSGYEAYCSFTENSIKYVVEFLKHKTFQSGFISCDGAGEQYGFSMRAITHIKGTEFNYGKSLLKRFFTRSAFKNRIPAGQFVFVNSQLDQPSVARIVDELARFKTGSVSLKNGVLDMSPEQIMLDPGWAIDYLVQQVKRFVWLTGV
jgi:hypothetical protein